MNFQSSDTSILDLTQPIRHWAEHTPDALAISTNDVRLSYGELEDRVERCAAYLADNGVIEHGVCALSISDKLLFTICWFALFRLQITSTAFAPDTPKARKTSVVEKCNASAVLTDSDETLPGTHHFRVDMASILDHPLDSGIPRRRKNNKTAMLITGSGTTGSPKMIAVGFGAIVASGPTESAIWGLGPDDVTFTTVSPWLSSVPLRVYNAFFRGGAFHLWSETELRLFDAFEKAGVTKIFAAVVQVEKFIGIATAQNRRLPNEAELTIYASVVTDGLVRRVKDHLTKHVKVVYGANELGVVADIDLTSETRPPGSVGRVSVGAQIEIVNQKDEPMPVGEPGLVRARAPRLFQEYVGEPDVTAQARRNGWFYPGDVAKIDKDGHLILLGRSDQMMIYDGINIHPAEIENVISTHPAVIDVAVMPLKHEVRQDIPICAVVIGPEHQISEMELQEFAIELLGDRMPGRIVFLDRIPRNESGKIIRKELADKLTEKLHAITRK